MGAALVLTFLFGTLGLFYTHRPVVAIVATISAIVLMVITVGIAGFIIWPVTMIVAALAVQKHNDAISAGARRG